jgi:hypothetical protein
MIIMPFCYYIISEAKMLDIYLYILIMNQTKPCPHIYMYHEFDFDYHKCCGTPRPTGSPERYQNIKRIYLMIKNAIA